MSMLAQLASLTQRQKSAVLACYLGWTLDAFDFFILIFVLKDVVQEFKSDLSVVSFTVNLTLAMRPIGALIFGLIADRIGRRPTLMADILFYSAVEFACGFAPSLSFLIFLRALYGIAMGGEWGVGASLTMETIPSQTRGIVSGILQAGYPSGYLLASILFGSLYQYIGWRGMFMVGVLPALLVIYIRSKVDESPAWMERRPTGTGMWHAITANWKLFIYTIVLMTAFNFFSHGTQDLYPTFLREQHKFNPGTVSLIAITYNIGAILGGLTFGAFSERVGRRRAIVLAALLSLLALPLWAFSQTAVVLALGAFVMQFLVQGAWGVVPVHLNELSPGAVRGTYPGFTYQLGNLFASGNLFIQANMVQAGQPQFCVGDGGRHCGGEPGPNYCIWPGSTRCVVWGASGTKSGVGACRF
jgi:SHS family lactate transporter-like MFS transporter